MRKNTNKSKKTKRKIKNNDDFKIEQDENFSFIAGYTSGGFPYGITWEETDVEPAEGDEDLSENIFDYIRKSKAFAYAKNNEYIKTEIYMDET